MADHIRKQIRDNVKTVLTGLATTGNRVHQTRVFNFQNAGLPALNILSGSQISEPMAIGSLPRPFKYHYEVIVEAYDKGNNIDDTLDTILKEIQIALTEDITRGNLAKDTVLQSVDVNIKGDSEKKTGNMRTIWKVPYIVFENQPDVAK